MAHALWVLSTVTHRLTAKEESNETALTDFARIRYCMYVLYPAEGRMISAPLTSDVDSAGADR